VLAPYLRVIGAAAVEKAVQLPTAVASHDALHVQHARTTDTFDAHVIVFVVGAEASCFSWGVLKPWMRRF
jgi:hypothetical protein